MKRWMILGLVFSIIATSVRAYSRAYGNSGTSFSDPPHKVFLPIVARNCRPPFIRPPETTDTNGEGVFHLPGGDVLVQVEDKNTNEPLAGISLELVSNGQKVLVLATDPNENYLPRFAEEVLSLPQAELPATTGAEYAAIIPIALKIWGAAEASLALIDIAKDPPRIEDYHLGYHDECWTLDQLCDAMAIALFIAKLPFSLSSAAAVVLFATAKVGKEAACEQLASCWDAQALPDPFRLRVYHGFSTKVVQLVGLCSGPQKTPFRIGPLARDHNGCSSAFSMRNPNSDPVFVTVVFRNLSGDDLAVVLFWLDPYATRIFSLGLVGALPSQYCGLAVIYTSFAGPATPPFPEGPPVEVTVITQCACP